MSKTLKTVLASAASIAAVASTIAAPASVFAWGDSSATGLRDTYSIAQVNAGALGDKIVFNSIVDENGNQKDERNFVSALATDADVQGTWKGNEINVENGKEYFIRLYVHNNSEGKTATDTKVAVSIPQTSAKEIEVNGYISASNATPNKYWDYVTFKSDYEFHLEYVYGSAVLYNNANTNGVALSDEIATAATKGGTLIGYDKLDGNLPGCYKYSSYVTVKVKAVYDTDYIIDKKVRLVGTKEWSNYVDAKVGDQVEFQIEYKNINKSGNTQKNVMIKDILPENLKYVENTTKLYNVLYPKGSLLGPDGDLFTRGVNIGEYTVNSNAYIRYTVEIVDENLDCGSNTLVNWGQGGVGKITIQDYASVILNKVCEDKTVEELPETGPEAIVGGVIAVSAIVTAGGYFIASRKALR